MTADGFRRMALGMADAVEREHMGHPDFRAPGPSGRIFATIHHSHESGGLILTPDQQGQFLSADPDAFSPAPGAWGRGGATTVRFASVDEETLGEAMTLAWQNVMNKAAAKPIRKTTKRVKKRVKPVKKPKTKRRK
jgi:hypothetical protein